MSPIERARLSLLGLSIGDGFGHGFMWDADRLDESREPKTPWNWTDDTEMAASVVQVLWEHGRIDQDALAQSFASHFNHGRMYGPAMLHRYFPRVRDGEPWRQVAGSLFDGQGSFGNGGAMRVAPLGAFFADDLEAVVENARLSAEVTHAHPEAAAGAIAVATAAAWAWRLREDPPTEPRVLIERVLEVTPSSEVREGLEAARTLSPHTPLDGAAQVLGNGSRVTSQDTVPFSIWSAGRKLARFSEALWDTVIVKGDMDTTGAIVGGIVSLVVGDAGIPARWREAVEPLPTWSGVEVTWWLMECDLPNHLNWARLTVAPDGSAEVLDMDGSVHSFNGEAAAVTWLTEDDFVRFEEAREAFPVVLWSSIQPPTNDTGFYVTLEPSQ